MRFSASFSARVMGIRVNEIQAKSLLSSTGIPGFDYAVNPYVGCAHGCRYCYASFMKRFTGHEEPWGTFVDTKTNAVSLAEREGVRKKPGRVILGSVTDAYQPLEKRYALARGILSCLLRNAFRVTVLTKSPLVLRDAWLFKEFADVEVGFSIGTDDERVRRVFERNSPPIRARVEALRKLKVLGVHTYAFIAPMLPLDVDEMGRMFDGAVDRVMADKMNYPGKVLGIIRERGWEHIIRDEWFDEMCSMMRRRLCVPFEAC